MTSTGPFADRGVLVTGGSRGIGRAIALAFAKAGADVGLSYQKEEAAAVAVVEELRRSGRRGFAYQSDAADPDAVRQLVEDAKRDLGRVDVLVANAGIGGPFGWEDLSLAEWRPLLETNLVGVYLSVNAAATELARTGGNAVLVASIAGLRANPRLLAYATVKAGVLSLARNLALALAPRVRVNAVAPGWVRTDLSAGVYGSPELRAAVDRMIPRGRWGEPEDVAKAVLFLASDGARFITGETLVVDGGNAVYWRVGADRGG
jgi:NAD(P)-dependent dehydrogenase (short-subunit alcohol dehydrogenase family)